MKRVMAVAIICLSVGHALGLAQRPSPYQQFGDYRNLACVSWTPSDLLRSKGYDRNLLLLHAPEHAWVYGYIAGAGYMPPVLDRKTERLMPIDVGGIDARIDQYCAAHPDSTLEVALSALVKELAAMR
jgi:hypothetical protein